MLTNYLKVSINNLVSHKLYSAINVLGLAVGLACFIFIALFIRHELSFDNYHPDADRVYRLSMDFDNGDRFWASNVFTLIPSLVESFPQIETGARLMARTVPVERGQIAFNESGFRLADPGIFQIFAFAWHQGDPAQALSQPFSLVLTESAAARYFGTGDPMGQTLTINNQAPVTVTGVIADLPDNTHLSGDMFTSMNTGVAIFGEQGLTDGFDFHSYVRLQPDTAGIDSLVAPMTAVLKGLLPNFRADLAVVPVRLRDIHFNPMQNELPGVPGSMSTIYTFSAIALGILLIACINFVNLSTARSSQRAKEVGMRKSIGASRIQLIHQFLGESVLFAVIATVIAVALVELLWPVFSNFVGGDIGTGLLSDPLLLLILAALSLAMGLGAGCYPAYYLASFEPTRVLKGDLTRGNAGLLFRNLLVIGQFSISIVLIIATAVIFSQMYYARNIELGYNKEQVVVLGGSTTQGLGSQWETMKQELLSNPEITSVTASMVVPGEDNPYGNRVWHDGGPADGTSVSFLGVDFNFFKTYEIGLLSGRTFDENIATDRMRFGFGGEEKGGAYVLSASAARLLGWSPEEALGKTLSWGSENGVSGPVIGVVDDVYYESVRNPQEPMLYMVTRSQFGAFSFGAASIRVTRNNLAETLSFIDDTWSKFMPGIPVSRSFLDRNFEIMYQAEDQQGELLTYFSILAVFIACLGLYGLASFNAERRTKEIGIRKVMGSSVWGIIFLLTNDFSKLVLISNVIAWPVAYFAMQRWLENFAYRIDLTPIVFIGSGLIALCIAWVTVGGTAARAASQKPVLALRYE